MLFLTDNTDVIKLITGSAGAVSVHASFEDGGLAGRTNTPSITTATTTTVVAAPIGGHQRRLRFLSARNDHASTANLVTIQHSDGTTSETLWSGNLLAGESVVFGDSGWQVLDANGAAKLSTGKLDVWVQAPADVVNATTAFADVTGLSTAVKNGKKYLFEAHLFHKTNADTTGAQFGVNGPAGAYVVQTVAVVTPDVAAAALAGGGAAARDTAAVAATTGPGATVALAILSGNVVPSADGTFAIRCASEVAVSSGLTVLQGSWLHLRELDN